MATSFCTNCGHKMTYNFSPPNFCGQCGTKVGAGFSAQASAPAPVKKVRAKQIDEDDQFDDDDEEYSNLDDLPQIQSLAYELENDSGNRQYQLGELFGQRGVSSRRNRSMSVDDFKERHGKRD